MQYPEDVKRLEDSIDNLSSLGEKLGIRLRKFISFIRNKGFLLISHFVFGIILGFFANFIRGLLFTNDTKR